MTLNQPENVREQYRDSGNFSARVDVHARFSTNPYGWPTWMFDRLDLPLQANILEVGCGPAFLWRSNIERVPARWRIVCTDMSPGMASEARAAIADERLDYGVADVQSLPFCSDAFDAVIANHMLYHVPDLDRALVEFERVLRPGGMLFAATNGRRHMPEVRELAGIAWRYIDVFSLENGPGVIGRYFDDVTVDRYEDALAITEADALMRYIDSMATFRRSADGEREDEMRRHVEEVIERDGAFRIQKDAGLIRARKR